MMDRNLAAEGLRDVQKQKTTHPVAAILFLIVIAAPMFLVAAVTVVSFWQDPSERLASVVAGLLFGGMAIYVTVRILRDTSLAADPAGRNRRMPEELERLWRDSKRWRYGFVYHCTEDPRIIVPRKSRWTGYSLNFAHKAAVPVLLGILLVLLGPFLLLAVFDRPASVCWVAGTFFLAVAMLTALCHWEATRARGPAA